jgi:hypothetical protein
MSETKEVSNILENYEDRSRLETILRIHKEGSISTEEAVNLLTGDRNYMVTNTLKKIEEEMVKRATPVVYPNWQPYVTTTATGLNYDPANPNPTITFTSS